MNSKVILKWLPQPSTPYCTVKDTISLSFVLHLLVSMFWYLVYLTTSKKMPNDCCSHPRPLTINQLSEASSLCFQWVSFFFLAPKDSGFSTLCRFTRKSFCSYHGAYMFEWEGGRWKAADTRSLNLLVWMGLTIQSNRQWTTKVKKWEQEGCGMGGNERQVWFVTEG